MYQYIITTIANGEEKFEARGTLTPTDCRKMLHVVQILLDDIVTDIRNYYVTIFEDGGNGRGVRLPLSQIVGVYGMYRRSFEEWLDDKPTWRKETFDMKEVRLWG